MLCEAITFLKPIAESCAHCHSSTVCSMPTSVGPMASLPKPPPPGVDSTLTLPSPSRCADAVAVRPLASVTSSVTVSPLVSVPRRHRLYSRGGSPDSASTVLEDDHLYVYGPVPPADVAQFDTMVFSSWTSRCARGPESGTAGTWRLACVPVFADGLQV